MKAKQIAEQIKHWVAQGYHVIIPYQPASIKLAFNAESHDFQQAVDLLKHEMPYKIEQRGYYRQASKAHSWQPDMYSFGLSNKEVKSFGWNEGMNGCGYKRKGSQWLASL